VRLVALTISYPRSGLEEHGPEDPLCFYEFVDLELEVVDELRHYFARFQCAVTTPQWVANELVRARAVWGAGNLLIGRWDRASIADAFRALTDPSVDRDWPLLLQRLERVLGASPDAIDP